MNVADVTGVGRMKTDSVNALILNFEVFIGSAWFF
jgi:hypothetical protein